MSVHFTKEGLVDDEGFEIQISYSELSKACLREQYSTIRIREIIVGAIEEILGKKIIVNNYCNNSKLFIRLEKSIQQHPGYQAAKKEIRRRAEMQKERTPKVDTWNPQAQRATRLLLLRKMNRKLY